jgi:hypothetical protein
MRTTTNARPKSRRRSLVRRLRGSHSWRGLATAVVLVALSAAGAPAAAQIPVIDDGMVSRNAAQSAQQVVEGEHEEVMIDYFLRLLLKLASYDWRDLDEAAAAVEAIMGAGDVLGYSQDDIVALFEETFPGYEDVLGWAAHHEERLRRTASSYEAILLSLREQHGRWEDDLGELGSLKLKVTATIQLGNPDGEGSKQTMMEVRAAARLFAQEETVLIRQAMMNRTLIRNLELADKANRRGHTAATIERMLGGGD